MQRPVWLRLGTAFLFSSSLFPGVHINNGGCLQSVSATESYRAVSLPVRPFSIHPTCFAIALRTMGSEMSDIDKIMAELKRDKEEKGKRLNEISEVLNTFTLAEQKEVLSKDNQEGIISLCLSKFISSIELREVIKKYPTREQLEIFNLPDNERKEELNKMQNELTNNPSSTIEDINTLRKLSRYYGLRNIVTQIDLDKKNITKEDAIELSKSVLPYCQKLTYLWLGGNRSIGDEGAAAVAAALSSNQCFKESLTALYLWGDNISDEGAKAIAGALPSLTELTYLNLSRNTIGDEGAKAIAGALPSLTKLTILWLHSNTNITQEGKDAVTNAVPAERKGELNIYWEC